MAKLQAYLKDLKPEKDWLYGEDQKWRHCVDKYGDHFVILDDKVLDKENSPFRDLIKPDWFCDIEFTLDEFNNIGNYEAKNNEIIFNRSLAKRILPETSDNNIEIICSTAEKLFPNSAFNPAFVKLITDEVYPDEEFDYMLLENYHEDYESGTLDLNNTACCIFLHGACSKNELMQLKDWFEGNLIEIQVTNELNEELTHKLFPECMIKSAIREDILSPLLCRECGQPSMIIEYLSQEINSSGEIIFQDFDYPAAIKKAKESDEDFYDFDREKQSLKRYSEKKHSWHKRSLSKATKPAPKHKKIHELKR